MNVILKIRRSTQNLALKKCTKNWHILFDNLNFHTFLLTSFVLVTTFHDQFSLSNHELKSAIWNSVNSKTPLDNKEVVVDI